MVAFSPKMMPPLDPRTTADRHAEIVGRVNARFDAAGPNEFVEVSREELTALAREADHKRQDDQMASALGAQDAGMSKC